MASGIYQIINSVNGKSYVGSAVNLDRRFKEHLTALKKGVHYNRYLQRACNTHGENAFVFQRLLICEKRDLLFYEQRAIDVLQPEYNLSPTAGNSLGVKHSAATRAKYSAARKLEMSSPERREQLADAARRHWSSDEARAAQSARKMGQSHPQSAETRAKISEAMIGNTRGLGVKKHSDEFKAALSARRKGIKVSAETIAKYVASRTGSRLSDEQKAKISAGLRRHYMEKSHG